MPNDNVLTDEQREQLELIERCQPDLLLMHIRENTAFDVALLERVFELAKERARALLASHLGKSEPRVVTGDYEVDHGTHVEWRPIYNEPEPRAEVTNDDKLCADRYRLLRRGQHWSVINGIGDTLRADELDAAIDAARTGASS